MKTLQVSVECQKDTYAKFRCCLSAFFLEISFLLKGLGLTAPEDKASINPLSRQRSYDAGCSGLLMCCCLCWEKGSPKGCSATLDFAASNLKKKKKSFSACYQPAPALIQLALTIHLPAYKPSSWAVQTLVGLPDTARPRMHLEAGHCSNILGLNATIMLGFTFSLQAWQSWWPPGLLPCSNITRLHRGKTNPVVSKQANLV